MKSISLWLFLLFALFANRTSAQISPPGLDDTNAALWGAVGFNQKLADRWSTTIYTGGALESNPNNYLFF